MRSEAAAAGFYKSEEIGNKNYPRIQLLTIEDILNGKKIDCPHYAMKEGNVSLKRAPKKEIEKEETGKQLKLT